MLRCIECHATAEYVFTGSSFCKTHYEEAKALAEAYMAEMQRMQAAQQGYPR